MQARNGYANWSDVDSAKDGFGTNDLLCDALFLDFQWFGSPTAMGRLDWNCSAFTNLEWDIRSGPRGSLARSVKQVTE